MNITLPPALFYSLGTLMILFGLLRAGRLGWRSRGELTDDDAKRRRLRRYHFAWGLVYVVMGGVLVLSTAGIIRIPIGH